MLETVGAIVAPASVITMPIASTLPVVRISAPWVIASVASSTLSARAFRALPPRRVAATPPSSEPTPHSPSSGPAAVVLPSECAAAATPTSVAPNAAPVPSRIPTSVRIAGDRSEPPRGRASTRPGRQRRDAGWTANASVPASITSPQTTRAAPGDHSDPSPSASGGPATNVSSSTVDSNANSAGSRLGSGTIAGNSVRTHAASGGVNSPVAPPSATRSSAGALDGKSPFATSTSAVTVAP
jgi:hypothetical protein